jgi:hypothetical protein
MSYIQKEYYTLKVPKQIYQTKGTRATITGLLDGYMPKHMVNLFSIAYRENDDFPKEMYVVSMRDDLENVLRSMVRNQGLELTHIHASPIILGEDQKFKFIGEADMCEW